MFPFSSCGSNMEYFLNSWHTFPPKGNGFHHFLCNVSDLGSTDQATIVSVLLTSTPTITRTALLLVLTTFFL